MPTTHPQSGIHASLAALESLGVVPSAAAALERGLAAVHAELRRTIVDEIPAFSESGNPDVLPELEAHAAEHVTEVRRLFGGGPPGGFDFVAAHAQRRAEQKFPLEASLHAYRCGHRVLSRWMRDAARATPGDKAEAAISAVADFAIDYTDTISNILAAEYVAHTRALAEAEGDRRTELLGLLLEGYDESDGRVARLLRRAGYLEQRQSFCIVLAQSVDPAEMENPARAQRMAESLASAVRRLPVRALLGVRDNVVTGVFSATRRLSGWTAPQTTLAERIRPELLNIGPAALIGMSTDQPSTSHIPKGLKEARMALDFASVAERVVQFSDLPLRRLLLHLAGDQVLSALPPWAGMLGDADRKARGALLATLRAYANADMNVLKAARELGVHPNTVYTRLAKIAEMTGLDGQRYHALEELLLVADCARR